MEKEKELETVLESVKEASVLNISLVGIGNAGNQCIAKASKFGFDVFAINSSLKDLNDTVVNENIHSFIIGREARGAGKSRSFAKKLFKQNGKDLFKESHFLRMIEKSDVIFVVGSLAGGTGSGVAPEIINLLKQVYPKKIVIYYGIMPRLSDSIMAQYNTIDAITEIKDLQIPYMLADLDFYKGIQNDTAYDMIANHIVCSISVIAGKYLYHTSSGMIDENDMRVIISEPGYMSAYILDKITQQKIDQSPIQDRMLEIIKNSPAVGLIRDGIVKQMGVMINLPQEISESAKSSDYGTIEEYIGTPYSVFENFATNNSPTGEFVLLLSGQNVPYQRLLLSKEKILQAEEKLKRVKNIDLQSDILDVEFVGNSKSTSMLMQTLDDDDEDDGAKKTALDSFFDN